MKKYLSIAPLFFLFSCDQVEPDVGFRSHEVGDLEVVANFNASFFETPESVALDHNNNAFISMGLTGEIRKITSEGIQSTHAVIPLGPPELCQGPFPGIMGALAIDIFERLYVPANACDPSNKGVWKITSAGQATLLASLPADALGNGIAVQLGRVYIADTAAPRIWTAPTWVTGPAEVWTTDPLLGDTNPFDLIPGANGLQFYLNEILVANASTGSIVAVPFEVDEDLSLIPEPAYVKYGPASTGPEHVLPEGFPGCDDFALDLLGRIYCTTDPFQTVARIDTDGSVEILFTAADGLDGPSAAAFGRFDERHTVYVTNANFPFFPGTGNGPSLMRFDVEVAGYPFR